MKRITLFSSLLVLSLAGCKTYEVSAVPPGHPASAEAQAASHHRSDTLDQSAAVDPQAQDSDHFEAKPMKEGDHAGHGGAMDHGTHGSHGDAQSNADAPNDSAAEQLCPVSGQKLGSMGKPVVVEHDGRYLMLCCSGCVEAFKQNPGRYTQNSQQQNADDQTHADPHTDHDNHNH